MKTEELPGDLRETLESLMHGSFTIECDVKDALENAENLKDFKERASGALNNLIQEASDLMNALGHKNGGPIEMDEFREIADPNIWKDLSPEEVREFVQWALDNWKPNTEVNRVWHPVIWRSWSQLDESFATAKKQILTDADEAPFIHREG